MAKKDKKQSSANLDKAMARMDSTSKANEYNTVANNISNANRLWMEDQVRANKVIDSISNLNNTFINKAVPNPFPNRAIPTRKMGGSVKKKKK
jgi:hypothetical protein